MEKTKTKTNKKRRQTPSFSAEEQLYALEAGATEFLTKMTTSPAKLAEIVKNALGKSN